jgi:hypothetical protein
MGETPLNTTPAGPPRRRIRMDARLDTTTRAIREDLATQLHRSRAAVLRQVMLWGLSREQTGPVDHDNAQGPVHHLFVMVDAELHQRVRDTAKAAGLDVAPWLRHLLRVVTRADFPASWQRAAQRVPTIDPAGGAVRRSHDSRDDGERFMLRLDRPASHKLQALAEHFATSRAEIIRQVIAQASPQDFPESWQMAVEECRQPEARRADRIKP